MQSERRVREKVRSTRTGSHDLLKVTEGANEQTLKEGAARGPEYLEGAMCKRMKVRSTRPGKQDLSITMAGAIGCSAKVRLMW